MRARDLVRESPLVDIDMSANAAARLLAEQELPGLIVIDDGGSPQAVLASTSVLRLVLSTSFQESAALAHTVDEATAEEYVTGAGSRTVRECLPGHRSELPVVSPSATVLEIAALMARTDCPMVAVVDQERGVLGSVTLQALLDRIFAS